MVKLLLTGTRTSIGLDTSTDNASSSRTHAHLFRTSVARVISGFGTNQITVAVASLRRIRNGEELT